MGTCVEAGGLRSFYAEDEPANPLIKRIVELIEAAGIYVNNQNRQRPILPSINSDFEVVFSKTNRLFDSINPGLVLFVQRLQCHLEF